jgi:amino acid adenylation domain-containing protein
VAPQDAHTLSPSTSDVVEGSLAERFTHVVSRLPDAWAIVDRDVAWTYAELNDRSERLAGEIQQDGSADRGPVLLLFDQTAKAISAMIACVRIGRPYVPLSRSSPQSRIDHIRANSAATLLLTETSCEEMAREISSNGLPVLDVEMLSPSTQRASATPPVSADAIVWILYTSGSTGIPKGVMQTHRNVLHFVQNYTQGLELSGDDRIALLYSYTSNAANHEIFSALLNGAAIYPYDVKQLGVGPLADWIERMGITIYSSVPTLFRYLVESLRDDHDFRSLRHVKMVGEPVYKRDLDAFRTHFPPTCTFINRLGSTETGTIRWFFANADTEVEGANVPVGYPVPDNAILLVDDAGRPVPAGESGEIVVRSRYLSPGYWRRPDLTERAFSGEGDRRSYRTGDIGQMMPGDCLVHLGRSDSQIKVRGYRIEVGEIEEAILKHPAVKNAVVVAREDRPDDRRLVGYYSLKPGESEPTVSELRRVLGLHLPDYMIPNSFVLLSEFPLAPNGKINRSELPPVGIERPNLETPYQAPRTPLEERVALLWQELLHLEIVGIRDGFLELGGHSLLATRLITRMQTVFGVELEIRDLFAHPTIEGLAEHVLEKMMVAQADRSDSGDDPSAHDLREDRGTE